jgi:chromosome partitioning protein
MTIPLRMASTGNLRLKIANLPVLLIANTKGGCAKTSIAQALAAEAKRNGHRVLVLDIDPIGSFSKWQIRRVFARALAEARRRKPGVAADELTSLIEEILAEPADPTEILVTDTQPHAIENALKVAARGGITFVIIDVAGSLHNYAETAAKFADMVLIPSKPVTKELEHLSETKKQLAMAGHPPHFVLFNRVHPQATSSLEQPRRIAREQYNITPFPYHFSTRKEWEDADDTGLAPQELEPNGGAAPEIKQAFKFISEFLNIGRNEENGRDEHARTAEQVQQPPRTTDNAGSSPAAGHTAEAG